ncbi:MAG: DUF1579 domain-containing protein [Ignavibacteriae bacterium]|nr:MAG: DUF1579 domain-containing protein [Ignavibacteriota bacterium]
MKTIFILTIIILQTVSYSQNDKPCSAPEASQFDFWVGEWNAEWDGENGAIGTGTNTITKIIGSCAVQENFSTSDQTFIGTSLSVYSPARKMWLQTWVDNMGSYLDFTGGMEGDKMILSRKAKDKDGNNILQRMVFYNITKDNFDWNWEASKDDGKNWELKWKIKYKRKVS